METFTAYRGVELEGVADAVCLHVEEEGLGVTVETQGLAGNDAYLVQFPHGYYGLMHGMGGEALFGYEHLAVAHRLDREHPDLLLEERPLDDGVFLELVQLSQGYSLRPFCHS